MPHAPDPSTDLLLDLGAFASRARIESVLRAFAALAGDDRSSTRLREITGGELDLRASAQRRALLMWLRAWGCRHLRVADTARSSRTLAAWWERHGASLPDANRSLTAMSRRELAAAAEAYGALAAAPAAWRSAPAGRVGVSFGETAAAKALFAIRPAAFPPWDAPIRVALGLGGAAGYRTYLEDVAGALRALAHRLEVPVHGLPSTLGRPGSSPPKLVDEYLWVRVNRPELTESSAPTP